MMGNTFQGNNGGSPQGAPSSFGNPSSFLGLKSKEAAPTTIISAAFTNAWVPLYPVGLRQTVRIRELLVTNCSANPYQWGIAITPPGFVGPLTPGTFNQLYVHYGGKVLNGNDFIWLKLDQAWQEGEVIWIMATVAGGDIMNCRISGTVFTP